MSVGLTCIQMYMYMYMYVLRMSMNVHINFVALQEKLSSDHQTEKG